MNDKRMKSQGTSSVWVVHGNYTKSGKPIYSANTHFDLGIPSMFHISELIYDKTFIIGVAVPGSPIYVSGRNLNLTWGPTSVKYDIS